MDSERWERIQVLFHDAADLPVSERSAYLEAQCADDPSLIAEVLDLLEEDTRSESMLDRGLAVAAHGVLEPATPDDMALPQQSFGAYRIKGVLGEGGMGVVYLAQRSDLGTTAAIKILRDAWLSPARRERFMAEQKTLAQLEHPSIARLYDSGTLPDGTPWFVMEYVEGTPVTSYFRSRESTVEEKLRLFRDICEAVQFAHSHLVIHRDLKPSNILVREDGSVKLLDFGISKQLDNIGAPAEQTRTAVRMMTPAYAAPEQIRGDPVGLHTDVYSLGVVLYELLVGRLPYDLSGRSQAEAETILLEREPEKPSAASKRNSDTSNGAPQARQVGRAAWADLDVLCLTAMHKDPERRYRTADALIRDVDHFLEQQPLEARADTARYRIGKFMRRNRRPVTAGVAVAAAVIALSVFYTVRLAAARNSALAETARTQRIQNFTLSLLKGGDEGAPADSLRVVSLLDRGVQEARILDGEPAIQAQLFETLGSLYLELGKHGPADTLLRASLAQRQALFGGEHIDVAQSLIALGMLRNAEAEYDSAEALVKRGLEMTRRLRSSSDPALGKATASLGQVLEERGDYDRAIEVLEEGVRLQSQSGEVTRELAANLTELANANFYAGNFAVSDTINKRVLAIDRRLFGPRHPNVANDLINLGAIQFEFGNFEGAEKYYREGLEITRPWFGNDHPRTAANLTMLGRALVSQKKLDEGSTVLTEALAINERAYGPVHPRVASALNELGRVAQQQGRLDDAEASFRRMAQIYRIVHKDKHYVIGVALSNLAGVFKDRKQYTASADLFRDVLRRYADELAADHQLVGIARVRLGEVLLLDRKLNDAERELLGGYQILAKQSTPPPVWMERARQSLVSVYDSLDKRDLSAKYLAELDAASKPEKVASAR